MSIKNNNIFESPENNFVFICQRCKSPIFQAKPDGIVECMSCGRSYTFVSAAQTWVPSAMDVEVYLEKYLHKVWDKNKKKFRNKDEVLREKRKNKKQVGNKKQSKNIKNKGKEKE